VRRFLVGALNVQTQGAAAQLTKRNRFQRSLTEGDVRLPKLFRDCSTALARRWQNSGHWIRLLNVVIHLLENTMGTVIEIVQEAHQMASV